MLGKVKKRFCWIDEDTFNLLRPAEGIYLKNATNKDCIPINSQEKLILTWPKKKPD
jgi:hypothetical protein